MSQLKIIYFGNDWFAENKTSSHHIAECLSKNHKVLYIECPGLRAPKTSGRDIKKLFSKIRRCLTPPQRVTSNLLVYTLFQIPFHKYQFIRTANAWMIRLTVRLLMKLYHFPKPILWFLLPHLSHLPGKIPSTGVIYYCIDNYSSLPGVEKDAISRMDAEMTQKADLVFVASQPLYDKKKSVAKNISLSPHGVDFNHFQKAFKAELLLPDEVKNIAHPIIGFWGLIEDWIDLDLVAFLATHKPDWQFVLIGHLAIAANPCASRTNVRFLGPRKYAQLPSYAQAFDALILPYRLNEQVYNCNPIKLREYLATGKPVVSVNYPEVQKYSEYVLIADSYEEFLASLEEATAETDRREPNRRIDRIKHESWENRVDTILKEISKTLPC